VKLDSKGIAVKVEAMMRERATIDSQAKAPANARISAAARPRIASASRDEQEAAKSQAPTSVQPVEPEDAYLTGVSRSLQRRLLGLNVQGSRGQSKPHPEASAAGQHATGSFTGPKSAPAKEPKPSKKS
jgi:hypothetical protein